MIIITGASDGLGLQLAKHYHEASKRVVNVSRRNSDYADENILADLEKPAEIENAIRAINAVDESIEAVINCAGVMSLESVEAITSSEIQRTFAVNIIGPMQLVSGLAHRIKQDGADVVNVASTVGTKAYPNQAAYGSSKWAMRGFSQNLQLEFKNDNCRVISFCVGGFNSNIAKKVTGEAIPDPQNWMNPSDIAKFISQILALPKNMEVSEIIINRKQAV